MSERGKYDCVVCGENIGRDTPRLIDPQRHHHCDRLMGSMWVEIRKERDVLRSQLAAAREYGQRMDALAERRRVDWQNAQSTADALFANQDKMRTRAETAERERDEARKCLAVEEEENAVSEALLAQALRERDEARRELAVLRDTVLVERQAIEQLRHRAERAERVVEAARRMRDGGPRYEETLYDAVDTFDAAEGTNA